MTGDRYQCCDERRRVLLAGPTAPADKSGIDYIEVRQGNPVSQPTTIEIVLVKPLALPAAQLHPGNIRITGGVRFPPPLVGTVDNLPGPASVASYVVTLPGGQQTDFSMYRLDIVDTGGADEPPAFIDPHLAGVDFSFKVDCGTELDCGDTPPRPEQPAWDEPVLDYRARDWEGLRRLMLDRISMLVPGFREDDPVDLTTTLVEALAYRADQQSYRLDWVSTEAFLDTARSRTSIVRHARLVDYRPAEGASARTYVALGFTGDAAFPDGQVLARGTPVLPRSPGLPLVVPASTYAGLLRSASHVPVVFETLADLRLWEWRSEIALHTWGDEQCFLPRGTTGATLVDGGFGTPGALAVGDLVLFEETAAADTGEEADADPSHRHVVRLTSVTSATDVLEPATTHLVEITWDDADALPFDLPITSQAQAGSGPPSKVVCAVARANVVLAEHGASLPPEAHLQLPPSDMAELAPRLDPPMPVAGTAWRPQVVTLVPLARVEPHLPSDLPRLTASALTAVSPAACLPAIELRDSFASWTARPDLLASGPFARDFVVEQDATGSPALRFGDLVHGLAPAVRGVLTVQGRFGLGTSGNVGPDALGHVVVADGREQLPVTRVGNPVAATDGHEPEPAAVVRSSAPEEFQTQQRAVTAADYARAALDFPGVANAMALPRWTGSWITVIVHVDRAGGLPVDEAFRSGLMAHMESYRLAGFDVAVRPARPVPLDVELSVCALPEEIRSLVGQRVRAALTPVAGDGSRGFFHPDRFTFGTPLYLSALVAAVMAVPGVQSVRPVTFQRFARLPQDEINLGVIRPDATEVLQLADDPSFPERGRLRITMGGGR